MGRLIEIIIRVIAHLLYPINIWKLKQMAQSGNIVFRTAYFEKMKKMGSYIGPDTEFATMPQFPHGILGVVIAGDAKIGKNCIIYHNVTIGKKTIGENLQEEGKNFKAPVIGNNVFIGAGAIILGDVHIGDNCKIGAGSVVTHDVPDNSIVVSQPVKIIPSSR